MGHSTIPDPSAAADPPAEAVASPESGPVWGPARGPRLSLAELTARTKVPAASIHHYRRQGLLPEPERIAPNRFEYDGRHVDALTLLRLLRERRRMPLAQIRDVLPQLLADHDDHAFRPEMWHDAVDALLLDPVAGGDVGSKLVDVAIEAFGEAGYAEVSVADLCDRAGIAKGSFYRHFDNKGELFLAAAQTVVDRAAADFERAVSSDQVSDADRARVLADLLRPGLPLLLELAKRSLQPQSGREWAAQEVFGDLAERLGTAVRGGIDADQVGGAMVLDAVVHIFSSTVMDGAGPDR